MAWGTTPVRHVIRNLIYLTGDYLSGSSFYSGLSAKTLWLSLPMMVYVVIRKPAKKREKLLVLMLAGMLVVAPFTVIYLNGAHLPVRTLFSLPLMIGMFYMLGYSHANSWLRKLLFMAALAILINNTWVNTRLFYASYVSWQADRDMANRIIERIHALFKTIGVNELNVIPFDRLDHLNEHVYRMPPWPAKGSVTLVDDMVVVKLSEPIDKNQ